MDELIRAEAEFSEARVSALAAGRVPPQRRDADRRPEQSSEVLVQPAGGEDPESEPERGGLQRELCDLADADRAAALSEGLAAQSRWPDVRRLAELRDPTVSHDWLWALNPAHGATVPPEEFATCVRVRLGAFLTDEPSICARCGVCIADRTAAHGLCCAAPEATRGHYSARDSLLNFVHLADPSATTEVPELIPDAPALRPADIYSSSALPGGQAALDIGICSPDAAGAGERKVEHYAEHLDGIRAAACATCPS